ncbi:sugar-transfer associated ATP-grasp domain-containing protein [Paraburkholderia strydomiana]|uniref:sugar-transfer associated ATP-grasp domain-containing protein n=1 Tax=Paraburkholderia strydomiana TaxID=1245417 RepID=UPI0038BAFE0E
MKLIDVETVARRSIKSVGRYAFHRVHGVQAKRVLRQLEKKYGPADPATLKQADTYALDVFGDAIYAPWLRVYAAFSGTFKEGWIPDNFYGGVVVPNMKGGYGRISNLKPMSRVIFGGDAFPDIAYFANGLFFTDRNVVVPERELEDAVFRDCDKVVFKLDGSGQGKGIHFFDRKSFDCDLIKSLGNGVIQKFIVQHPLLSAFAANSVATLRLTTAVDDLGRASLRAAFLRVGRASHTHITVDDEVCVPVDLVTGEFARKGFMSDWGATEEHPDSKVRFAGLKMPAFSDCIDTVLQLHRKVPFARCIGWDVTVDSDGKVQIMEWNGEHNDVKFSEATQGPCFQDLNWELLKGSAL